MRTLIQNGRLCDGSGAAAKQQDLYIEGDKISAGFQGKADLTIDAAGCVITPGFIDTHRHCDIAALCDESFGALELSQGITTAFCGNCGLTPIPAREETKQDIFDYIEPCLGKAPKSWKYTSMEAYFTALRQKGLPLNLGSFIGLGSLTAAEKGYGRRPLAKSEQEKIQSYIREGLESGAAGLSSGLMYQPECDTTEAELLSLLSVATPYHRPLTCHIRGEGDHLVPSVREVIRIAKAAELPLNISHFKATGLKNWNRNIHMAIEEIETARAEGQDVTVDFYPYCGGSTTLMSLIPPTVLQNSPGETIRFLQSPHGKKTLQKELYKEHAGWDNMVTGIGWERILISSVTKVQNRQFCNLNLRAAATVANYGEPADFLCDLLGEEAGKVGIILMSMSPEDVDTVAKLPYSMVISDALYGGGDSPHPRLYGSFPKIIRDFVLERKVLTLEEAIGKMTALPAKRLGLQDRGLLAPGKFADINVFRPETFRDHAEFGNPKQLSTGLMASFIGGKLSIHEEHLVNCNNGTVMNL